MSEPTVVGLKADGTPLLRYETLEAEGLARCQARQVVYARFSGEYSDRSMDGIYTTIAGAWNACPDHERHTRVTDLEPVSYSSAMRASATAYCEQHTGWRGYYETECCDVEEWEVDG